MKFKRTAVAVIAAGALAIPFAGTSAAQQDTPEDLIAECEELGPTSDTIENPDFNPEETIPNPAYDPDAPPLIDDVNTQDGEVDDPATEEDETTSDPNPVLDEPETLPNPDFDPNETIANPEYEDRLDPSGNGIACDIEDVAIWEELVEPTTTPETTTPEPTTETTTPEPTTETETVPQQTQSQSQTVVVAPPGPVAGNGNEQGTVTRNPAARVPVQAIPSGPISR